MSWRGPWLATARALAARSPGKLLHSQHEGLPTCCKVGLPEALLHVTVRMQDKCPYLALGDDAVDVVVVPSAKRKDLWHLHDRLRRKVGTITEETPARFVVHPTTDGPLATAAIKISASLEEAMDNIAGETKGECQLSEKAEG